MGLLPHSNMREYLSMKNLLGKLFGADNQPRPYERACLDAFSGACSPEGRMRLDAQMAHCRVVRRWRDRSAAFTPTGRDPLPQSARFPYQTSFGLACGLRVTAAGVPGSLEASLVVIDGELAQLDFGSPPLPFRSATDVRAEVLWHLDVMEPAPVSPLIDASALAPLGLPGDVTPTKVLAPAPPAVRAAFVERLGCEPPAGLAELLALTDGFEVNGWDFYGVRTVRRIIQDQTHWIWFWQDPLYICSLTERGSTSLVLWNDLQTSYKPIPGNLFDAVRLAVVSELDPEEDDD